MESGGKSFTTGGLGKGRPSGLGLGPRTGGAGLGLGRGAKRHRKIMKDTIFGITKGDIRRLARRGGVKRISSDIYQEVRLALKQRLSRIVKDIAAVVEAGKRKTVSTSDVVFVLNRHSLPIYGFGEAQR